MWNKDERKGRVDHAKGTVKQAVGALTGTERLKTDGRMDEIAGKVQAAAGGARRTATEAIARAGKAVKR
jgi:uncharacterized protein YjbJ (UPF0337 family)